MNKNKIVEGLYGSAIGVIAGCAAGLTLGGGFEQTGHSRRDVAEIRADIDRSTERAQQVEIWNAEIQKYGEICISLVDHYAYGGDLDGTEVDTPEKIASAVLTVEDKPCGENKVEALSITQDILRVRDTYKYFQRFETRNVNNYQQELRDSLSLAEDDDKHNWALLGALGGSVLFGSLFGIGFYRDSAPGPEKITSGDSIQ